MTVPPEGRMRALVVDDDLPVRRVVRRALEREGATVEEASEGITALQRHAEAPFDVIILDHLLPGMSGLEILQSLRQRDTDVHVIMLTGAGGEADLVRALANGADDYVAKPFSVRELAARAHALERRRHPSTPEVLEIGALRIEDHSSTVTIAGQAVDLRRREYELLRHLASQPGRTFTREELLEAVWRSSGQWQNPATVTEHIRRLRLKIEPLSSRRLIETVRGIGYRFDPGEDPGAGDLPDDALSRTVHDLANWITVIATTAELAAAEVETAPIDVPFRDSLLDDLRTVQEAAAAAATLATSLLARSSDDDLDHAGGPLVEPAAAVRGCTILLVEDDDDLRATTGRVLRNHGYTVLAAAEAQEALDLHIEHREEIDLLLTDVMVPDLAIGEVSARIRAMDPAIPLLYMSGFSQEVLAATEMVASEEPLLAKPFTARALLAKVAEVCGQCGPDVMRPGPTA